MTDNHNIQVLKAMKQSLIFKLFLFGAVGIAVLVAVLSAIVSAANQRIENMYIEKAVLVENINRFTKASSYLTSEVRAYAATGEQSHYDNYWNEINNAKNRDIAISNIKAVGIPASEQALIDKAQATSNNLIPMEEKAMELVQKGDIQGAVGSVFDGAYDKAADEAAVLYQELKESIDERTQSEIKRQMTLIRVLTVMNYVLIVIMVAFLALTYIIINKKILHPIKEVEFHVKELSKGNLSFWIDYEPNTSEIGQLVYSLILTREELKKYVNDIGSKMSSISNGDLDLEMELDYIGDFKNIQGSIAEIIASLNRTMSRIHSTAESVSMGADQISHGAQALAQGTVEQAGSIDALSVSIADVSEMIRNTAANSSEASTLSQEMSDGMKRSSDMMNELNSAMELITSKANEIQNIIKIIDDIAFQTNILALNAAVEAARAGEAGKGFAVVADEVRNLAQKSSEAVKNITGLISDTISAVNTGTKAADNTSVALNEVVEKVDMTKVKIQEIADDSSKEANIIASINTGIDQISSVVQNNSATAEQSAAASEELNSQADGLKELVSVFKLKHSI